MHLLRVKSDNHHSVNEPWCLHYGVNRSKLGLLKKPKRLYDNEITSLIDIYFLRISFIPSDLFRYFIYVTYSIDK